MAPHLIASGLGLADRKELSGLLALFEAATLMEVGVGAWNDLLGRLGREVKKQADRVADHADELHASDRSDDELRHMLWLKLTQGLDLGTTFSISDRRISETASALGVMASRTLSPALQVDNKRERANAVPENENWFSRNLKDIKGFWKSKPPFPFPEVVARELAKLVDNEDLRNGVDPDVAKAMNKAGNKAAAVVAAGGSWIGIAALVSSSGFAPYILAAHASAFIPFMSGPAVVSLLAVLVNPLTIIAGLAALGGFGGMQISSMIRKQVAARIAVLLAIRGTEDPAAGLSHLVDSLRNVTRPGASNLSYLAVADRQKLRQHVALLEPRLGRDLPRHAGTPPAAFEDLPVRISKTNDLGEAAAVAGLTGAEMLYRAAVIDARVIEAADFWRSADLSGPLAFAAHAHELQAAGADIALRGYVAEHVVMGQLVADGHDVALASSASNPGWDLLVNGQPVQVKCGLSIDLLRKHFETYPDIPVITNTELMEKALDEPWADLVMTIEGFELGAIETITNEALEAGLELASHDVLATALGVGALRGGLALLRGEIPASHLPAWLVVDVALKIPIVGISGKLGGLVGLVAIGPAGALILGPVAGVVAVAGIGPAKEAFDRIANSGWHQQLKAEGETLHAALKTALNRRADVVLSRCNRLRKAVEGADPEVSTWIELRAYEDAVYAVELLETLGPAPTSPSDVACLLLAASRTSPADPDVLRASTALRRRLSKRPGPLDGALERLGPAKRTPASGS